MDGRAGRRVGGWLGWFVGGEDEGCGWVWREGGWMGGWVGGWVDGWVGVDGGWMN